MIQRQSRKNIDLGTLKHYIISIGNMMLSNGFGVRFGCHQCCDGIMNDGTECWICHSENTKHLA